MLNKINLEESIKSLPKEQQDALRLKLLRIDQGFSLFAVIVIGIAIISIIKTLN